MKDIVVLDPGSSDPTWGMAEDAIIVTVPNDYDGGSVGGRRYRRVAVDKVKARDPGAKAITSSATLKPRGATYDSPLVLVIVEGGNVQETFTVKGVGIPDVYVFDWDNIKEDVESAPELPLQDWMRVPREVRIDIEKELADIKRRNAEAEAKAAKDMEGEEDDNDA